MDAQSLQTVVVAIIVALAALFVGRRFYRTLASARKKHDAGCGGGCGCGTE